MGCSPCGGKGEWRLKHLTQRIIHSTYISILHASEGKRVAQGTHPGSQGPGLKLRCAAQDTALQGSGLSFPIRTMGLLGGEDFTEQMKSTGSGGLPPHSHSTLPAALSAGRSQQRPGHGKQSPHQLVRSCLWMVTPMGLGTQLLAAAGS